MSTLLPRVLPTAGLILLLWRIWPLLAGQRHHHRVATSDVSIIIPARNEEKNIRRLLHSLQGAFEIIVVDDHSSDRTAEIARFEGAHVVTAPNRPSGWTGKNWACFNGALSARGSYLLFTDADTVHDRDSLARVFAYARENRIDLLSAVPFHLATHAWEKGLSLFHLLLLALTAAFHAPKPGRFYAIGQFLLFRREAYFAIGGHRAVRGVLSEDIELARLSMSSGLNYAVYPHPGAYSVQMYESMKGFIEGWRRNFRLGLRQFGGWAVVDVVLLFSTFAAILTPRWPAALAAIILLLTIQGRLGHFRWTSAPMIPIAMGLFTWISVLAVTDRILGRDFHWKNRRYPAFQEGDGA